MPISAQCVHGVVHEQGISEKSSKNGGKIGASRYSAGYCDTRWFWRVHAREMCIGRGSALRQLMDKTDMVGGAGWLTTVAGVWNWLKSRGKWRMLSGLVDWLAALFCQAWVENALKLQKMVKIAKQGISVWGG